MSDTSKFNPQKRICIAKGKEGCPACIVPINSVRDNESFAMLPDGVEKTVEATMGICLITCTEIVIGGTCSVPDKVFANPSLSRLPY